LPRRPRPDVGRRSPIFGERIVDDAEAEIATIAGSKRKKSKARGQTRAKAVPKRAIPKRSWKKVTKPTRKPSSAKKVAAKKGSAKKVPARRALARKLPAKKTAPVKTRPTPAPPPSALASPKVPAPPPKTFAQEVHDGDAGTEVWYRVGDDVVRGELRGRGSPGFVAILRNCDINGVGEGNVFETAEHARAAQ
jgi:hypothetical protein